MLEEIQASKEVIMSRFQNSITHRMNIRVVAVRSVDEVKKNWKAVKSDTTGTPKPKENGRWAEEKPPIYADLVFSIIGERWLTTISWQSLTS